MSIVLKRLGTFFYLVDYNSTTFYRKEDVPNYMNEGVPLFLSMVALEYIICYLAGRRKARLSDATTSTGHGIVYETSKVLTRGAELYGYNWLYEHRLFDLDWSSPVTWFIAAIGVDFGYYWYHRASHETSLGWAAHQVHHSSEDFNLTTALRQSIFQRAITMFFYNPLALLGVPFPAVLVHIQFNLLYGFWIHTDLVKKLGPLEWILNTPSHHRVHHGANKWCLDKNYAGVLIIWDRIFGTFQEEKEDEEIVYGLTDQPQTFNVLFLQMFYYRDIFLKARSMDTWGDFFRSLIYGPGWLPETQKLGNKERIPDVKSPRVKYDPKVPMWQGIYMTFHFLLALAIQQILVAKVSTFTWYIVLFHIVFILVSISLIGAFYDGWWWAPFVEAIRCIIFFSYSSNTPVSGVPTLDAIFSTYFAFSALMWTLQALAVLTSVRNEKKLQ